MIRRNYFKAAAAAALAVGLMQPARAAQTELVVDYPLPALFKQLHEDLARRFMEKNPGVKVTFLAPTANYEEATQRVLRQSITKQLPDLTFQGLNRQRVLVDRGLAVDLTPFVKAEPDWANMGYDDSLLSLGKLGGKQYGMGFSLSTPVVYFNVDLVTRAGGDPEKLPADWDGILDLGRKIKALDGKTHGFQFDWDITGNWLWQALVFSHGGTMLTADETKVAFDGAQGQASMRLFGDMVMKAGMRNVKSSVARQDFVSGNLGIWVHSTSFLGNVTKQIGDRFEVRTGRFPLPDANGRLPAGGNVVMMLTRDPKKQKAAWEYIKFVTGPEGATAMVKATGYFPANALPAKRPELLGTFYQQNPNHMTAISQLPLVTGWYAFPGENGLKITDVINDHVQSVIGGAMKPDQGLASMTSAVQALLPR